MSLTTQEAPTFRGMELMPISPEQYQRLLQEGILKANDPVEFREGYLVGKDDGLGQTRPQPCVIPPDAPRYLAASPITHAAGMVEDGDVLFAWRRSQAAADHLAIKPERPRRPGEHDAADVRQMACHVTRGEIEGAAQGDGGVREIAADTIAPFDYFRGRKVRPP